MFFHKEVNQHQFQTMVLEKMDRADWRQLAQVVFHDYGKEWSYEVTNVLWHAIDQGKVEAVLNVLDLYQMTYSKFQDLENKGTVCELVANKLTNHMFRLISEDILGFGIAD